jgi:hypothetical protein
MVRKFIVIIVFVLGFSSIVSGQIERNKNSIFRVDRTELGLGAGATFYLGDYNELIPFVDTRYYGTVLHRFYFNLLYALRTSISFGNIAGNSKYQRSYNPYYDIKYGGKDFKVYFNRNFIDFNTGIELGFRAFEPVEHRVNRRFTPYLFIGVGITILYSDPNSKTDEARAAYLLEPRIYGTSDINSGAIQAFNIPIGLGFKYSPWKRWTIGAEWQFKKTFNDDIDRFNNIKPSIINNNKRGSLFINTDWMSFLGVSVSYRLAIKNSCSFVKKRPPSTKFLQGINRDYNLYDNNSKKKK